MRAAVRAGRAAPLLHRRRGDRRHARASRSRAGAIRKVRQSVTRLEQRRLHVRAARSSARLDAADARRARAVSDALARGAPERGFSMAMDALRGEHCDTLVVRRARRRTARSAASSTSCPPTAAPACRCRSCAATARRRTASPSSSSSRSIELLRARGVDELSLNFAAFARLLHDPQNRLERCSDASSRLANPFFQIESLYRFNAKFSPRWEPRYLLYSGRLGLPRAGLAAVWAEGHLPKPFVRRP